MKQVTMSQLRRANTSDLKGWVPFEIVSDGEVIARVGSATSRDGLVIVHNHSNQAVPQAKLTTSLLASVGYTVAQASSCGTCWRYDRRKLRCSKRLPEVGGCESYRKIELDADGQPIPE